MPIIAFFLAWLQWLEPPLQCCIKVVRKRMSLSISEDQSSQKILCARPRDADSSGSKHERTSVKVVKAWMTSASVRRMTIRQSIWRATRKDNHFYLLECFCLYDPTWLMGYFKLVVYCLGFSLNNVKGILVTWQILKNKTFSSVIPKEGILFIMQAKCLCLYEKWSVYWVLCAFEVDGIHIPNQYD